MFILLIWIPPFISVSKAVQLLKWSSSHELQQEFESIRKRYWWQHLRAREYRVVSSGNVTDEMRKDCIDNQKSNEPDDDFQVL